MKQNLRVNSHRLAEHDYSQPGAYFVTICTSGRQYLFGEIIDGQMQLNDAGTFAQRCWREIPQHFAPVTLDEYVIMPNHVHGIIIINADTIDNSNNPVGVQHVEPLRVEPPRVEPPRVEPPRVEPPRVEPPRVEPPRVEPLRVEPLRKIRRKPQLMAGYQRVVPGSLGAMMRGFKSAVTRWFRANTQIKTVWQRNFHDHIVRNESELNRIQSYIRHNPAKWQFDRQNRDYTHRVCEPDTDYGYEPWML